MQPLLLKVYTRSNIKHAFALAFHVHSLHIEQLKKSCEAAYDCYSVCSVSDDIGVPLNSLQLLSERNTSAFVPRLSVNKGMLPVRLKLTGTDDLPGSAAVQVGYQYSSLVRGVVAWLAQHARLSCTVGYLSRQVPG
jgi:hypothetical protein